MKAENITAINAEQNLSIFSGTIDAEAEQGYRVIGPNGHVLARQAFSCLLQPKIGDKVLFSVNECLQGHILSILERGEDDSATLSLPGDMTLRSESGQINLQGQQGVSLSSPRQVQVVTEEYNVNSKRALLHIESIRAVGKNLVSNIHHLQVFGHTIETVAQHWMQKLKNAFRQVEVDQLKTRDSLHTVDNLYSVRSRQAAILAEKDMKVDAERIHMG